ncbi:hypothetical protein L7F22_013850 [Adiantum nelumboides]|nr:hypothetical protein [Adiantum nelumboides]
MPDSTKIAATMEIEANDGLSSKGAGSTLAESKSYKKRKAMKAKSVKEGKEDKTEYGDGAGEIERDGVAKKPTEDAKRQTKTSKDQVEKDLGKNSNMKFGRKGGPVGVGGVNEDMEIIIENSEPPKENSDESLDAGGDASCAGGGVGAGEDMKMIIDKSKPPPKNGDVYVDASGDASYAGGACSAGEDTEIIIKKFVLPYENGDAFVNAGCDTSCGNGAFCVGSAKYARRKDGMVSLRWEDGGDAIADWGGLRMAFMQRFGAQETSKKLWKKLCELRLVIEFDYGKYELQFTDLWDKWVATLAIGERATDFLKRYSFVACLCLPLKDKALKDKVKARFPVTFEAAMEVARLKERKLRYQLQHQEVNQEGDRRAQPPPGNVAPTHRGPRVVDQQELLSRITNHLEDLSVHLIKAPAPLEHGRDQIRQPQDYHCYNCGEEEHQTYFFPHQRRNADYRGPGQQVSPPRGRQQQLYQPPIPM